MENNLVSLNVTPAHETVILTSRPFVYFLSLKVN